MYSASRGIRAYVVSVCILYYIFAVYRIVFEGHTKLLRINVQFLEFDRRLRVFVYACCMRFGVTFKRMVTACTQHQRTDRVDVWWDQMSTHPKLHRAFLYTLWYYILYYTVLGCFRYTIWLNSTLRFTGTGLRNDHAICECVRDLRTHKINHDYHLAAANQQHPDLTYPRRNNNANRIPVLE